MSLLFPGFGFAPSRCGPTRNHEVAPVWNLFDETFNELQRAARQSGNRPWNPRFDVKETKDAYSLEGELPGIEQKDINIEFTDEHTLTIKGRTESSAEKGQSSQVLEEGTVTPPSEKAHQATVEDDATEPATANGDSTSQEVVKTNTAKDVAQTKRPEHQFWYRERSVGEFTRSFSFPTRVDQEAVKASLKNGILSIVVPKATKSESRRINIE